MTATMPADLVARARDGDMRALDKLLLSCRPDLERFAKRHCAADDVDEAVQDALWIVSRRVTGLRSVAAFMGWVFQVVRRACLRYAMRRRRRGLVSSGEPPPETLSDGASLDPELRVRLTGLIVSLPPRYRDVLILRDIQGLSTDEAAANLALTPEAAKSRLHRARSMVREAFWREEAQMRTGSSR